MQQDNGPLLAGRADCAAPLAELRGNLDKLGVEGNEDQEGQAPIVVAWSPPRGEAGVVLVLIPP